MNEQLNEQPTPKRRRGCLFFGCLAGIICLVGVLVAGLLVVHVIRKALNEYTDTKPMPIPAVEISQQQAQEVQRRFDNFSDAVSAGRPTAPLELSTEDINVLIATSPSFQAMKEKLYVTIQDGQIRGQVSIPLQEIGFKMLKGRYFNGTGIFSVSLKNGILSVVPEEITVRNRPLPGPYMERFRRQNMVAGINDNPKASVALNHLQDIQIKDGKLILVPKKEQ
jgi:hypothetical protein